MFFLFEKKTWKSSAFPENPRGNIFMAIIYFIIIILIYVLLSDIF